jgi:hypothetical protein
MAMSRNLAVSAYAGVAVVGAFLIIEVPHLVFSGQPPRPPPNPGLIALTTICALIGVTWAMVFAALAFRRMGEFEREASKFSWYWGSTAGIALSGVLYTFIGLGGLTLIDPSHPIGTPLFRAFVTGYSLPIVSQLVAFLAVRLWWQVAKR